MPISSDVKSRFEKDLLLLGNTVSIIPTSVSKNKMGDQTVVDGTPVVTKAITMRDIALEEEFMKEGADKKSRLVMYFRENEVLVGSNKQMFKIDFNAEVYQIVSISKVTVQDTVISQRAKVVRK